MMMSSFSILWNGWSRRLANWSSVLLSLNVRGGTYKYFDTQVNMIIKSEIFRLKENILCIFVKKCT